MRMVFLVMGLSLCISMVSARTIYVDDDGPANFNNIQSAIDDANDYDVIIVKDGLYTGAQNKNLDFDGRLITLQSMNGPEKTIIDCENNGRAFYFHSFETTEAKVIGFTITNGNVPQDHGGAILVEYSELTIEDCIITNNTAEYSGGAILFDTSLESVINNCVIKNNTATDYSGGGIFAQYCDITINNTVIASNQSGYFGGGLTLFDFGVYDIINCTIVDNNDNMDGGGIYVFYDADVVVANTILYGNDSNQIELYSVSFDPVVEYCDVQGGFEGLGNIDVDPCFVDAVAGDFHLRSETGRWHPTLFRSSDLVPDGFVDLLDYTEFAKHWFDVGPNIAADLNLSGTVEMDDLQWFVEDYLTSGAPRSWATDGATSRCIDAGNPGVAPDEEPFPASNLRINMGAYGRTHQASASPVDWSLLADLDNDGTVNLTDFAAQASYWQDSEPQLPGDLTRDGIVNLSDLELLAQDWLDTTSWF